MTLNKAVEKALNDQVNREFQSFYLYLSMAQWFARKNWKGFAHWMNVQAKEELSHGYKILAFLQERNSSTVLSDLKTPRSEWASPTEAMEEAYRHEQGITASIAEIFSMARKESDFTTESFLKWFVDEQMEEESSALEIVDMLRTIGDAKPALFMLDRQLAQRKD